MSTTLRNWRRLLAALLTLAVFATACGSDTAIDVVSDAVEDVADTAADTAGDVADTATDVVEDAAEVVEDTMDGDDETMEEEPMEEISMISAECNIPNPAEEVEIDVMGWEFPIITQYADELEECEEGNYSFNVQFLDSAQAQDAMRLDGSTGSPEFEMYQGSNSFILELANAGALMPLNDLIAKYGADYGLNEIDQAFFDFASLDGNVYAIPMVSNTMHVFYNAPKLAEVGVEVPTTFEEALAACPAIQAAGYDTGFLYMLSAGWAWGIEFNSVLGANGLRFVDTETNAPLFNGPEGIAAATTLKTMLDECGGTAASAYSTDDIQAAFQTGEIILGHTWASRAAAMDDAEASTEVGNIEFAPALSTGGDILAAPAYIDGYGIPKGVDPAIVDDIFLAILAASDRESQEAAAEFGLVTRTGVTNANGPRNGAAAEASLVAGRGPDLPTAAAAIARAKVGDAMVTILDGTSVEDALAAAEAAYIEEATAQGLLG